MGVVLTYKVTGVFNFAHGAIAMIVAYSFWQLRAGWSLPLWLAVPVALIGVGGGLGFVLERFVFRPLDREGARTSEKLVATLGVFTLLLGAAYAIWTGKVRQGPRLFSNRPLLLGAGLRIGTDQLVIVVLVVVISAAVWVLFRRTQFGTEIRAVVDRRTLAELTAVRADRVAGLSWALGCVYGGIGVALVALPFTLSLTTYAYGQRMVALMIVFVSIVVITGFSGYITLGQGAFAGFGGFVAARVANSWGMPVIPAMVVGGVGAMLMGLAAGWPALRRRGLFL